MATSYNFKYPYKQITNCSILLLMFSYELYVNNDEGGGLSADLCYELSYFNEERISI